MNGEKFTTSAKISYLWASNTLLCVDAMPGNVDEQVRCRSRVFRTELDDGLDGRFDCRLDYRDGFVVDENAFEIIGDQKICDSILSNMFQVFAVDYDGCKPSLISWKKYKPSIT